nr:putative receptor protein kinase ZmPK1 [Tanacetum cinerariifolium]
MLADSLLPIPFWAEAVKTACYVQNRVLVTKPQNKTSYELLHGRTPSIGFMRPFGCPVTILNTLISLGKFEGNVDEGFLVGYSMNSKAFRVFNSQTRIVQETLHVNFLENKANIAGTGPTWLFDIDSLTRTMNYHSVTTGNQSNLNACFQEEFDARKIGEEAIQQYMLFPVWSTGSTNLQNIEEDATFDGNEHSAEHPKSTVNFSPSSNALSGEQDDITMKRDKGKSPVDYFTGNRDFNKDFEDYSEDSSNDVSAAGPIVPTAGQNYFNSTNPISVAENEDIVYSDDENVGAEADFNNLETSITVKQKEDGIFINQDKFVAEILKKFGLTEGKSASTPVDTEKPLLKDADGEDVDVHIYRSMIGSLMYLTSSRPDIMFASNQRHDQSTKKQKEMMKPMKKNSDDVESTKDWDKIYKIALGTAKRLAYLHEECLDWILHCDVKRQNILLDCDYKPKVADSRLSRLLDRDDTRNLEFTKARRTRGYMALEWLFVNILIMSKVNVYRYGVIMLEMITGQSPTGANQSEGSE